MADTWETLKDRLRAGDDDDAFIERCFDDATNLINEIIGDNYVPDFARELAVLKQVS